MRWSHCLVILLMALFLFEGNAPAQANPPGFRKLSIGDAAPDFRLPGVDDKEYTLKDFADAKLLLVVFTCNHCPTAQAYEPRIMQIQKDYRDQGVAVVAISPNDDQAVRLDELGYTEFNDSLPEMKLRAKAQNFNFPYLYDGEKQQVSASYGVVATPQVFLFDQDRKLRYSGRIDDSDVREVKSHDTRNAIDALLSGKPVPVETTRTFGCSTKWSDKRSEVEAAFQRWAQEPVTIQPLDEESLKKLVKNETEDYLLIDVWATWCGPCVAELPAYVEMNRMYRNRNFKFVTISMDEPDQQQAALKILKQNQVSSTNYHLAIENRDRFADLLDKEWDGPIPYLVLIAPGGKVIYRKQGTIDPLEVKTKIVESLGRTYASKKKK